VIILDTNVISELLRPQPAELVIRRLKAFRSADRFTTAITEAEIRYGLAILPAGRRRHSLQVEIDRIFREIFSERILPFDSDAVRAYSEIAAERRARGIPISQSDAQIAGITRVHAATLITRNYRDFQGCRFPVVNPWEEG
jgi:predicted nucleic acid-binding protein